MISVVMPTLNSEATLPAALAALIPATIEGIVREVVVCDGGSTDRTLAIADAAGAVIEKSETGRGRQMRVGGARARQPWLLFLHSDTVLERDWERDALEFMERVDTGRRSPAAAAFRFRLDDRGWAPGLVEAGVRLRCSLFAMPYGDQGLLVPAKLYREIGTYADMPLLEDVEMVRRLGRKRLEVLRAAAVTSAKRYRDDGYAHRVMRNWCCVAMYRAGVPVEKIQRFYVRNRT